MTAFCSVGASSHVIPTEKRSYSLVTQVILLDGPAWPNLVPIMQLIRHEGSIAKNQAQNSAKHEICASVSSQQSAFSELFQNFGNCL